jgi:hypothetical protein
MLMPIETRGSKTSKMARRLAISEAIGGAGPPTLSIHRDPEQLDIGIDLGLILPVI